MPNEKITCRIAIQTCVGYFPDGRERHRTFSLRGVRPDVSPEAIRSIIRALAPLLKYPITKVTKVIKREMFFDGEERNAGRNAGDAPYIAVPTPRISDGPVSEHPPVLAKPSIGGTVVKSSSCASRRQKRFTANRAPQRRRCLPRADSG